MVRHSTTGSAERPQYYLPEVVSSSQPTSPNECRCPPTNRASSGFGWLVIRRRDNTIASPYSRRVSPLLAEETAQTRVTGSHRALEEFLGPRFHIRARRGESAFRGLHVR